MCDRLHTYTIDVGSSSETSTKSATAGSEATPGVRQCLVSGVSGRRLQSPRLRGRSRLGTASACHFLQGEYGGAGDRADDGKRQAIEHKQEEQRADAAVGPSAGDRLPIGAELGKADGARRIEKSKTDRQRNGADKCGDPAEATSTAKGRRTARCAQE